MGREDGGGSWNRRQFVVRSSVAAGIAWVTPSVRSVRIVDAAGSPAPGPTESTVPPQETLVTGGGFVDDNHFGFNSRTNGEWASGQLNYTFRASKGPPTKVHSNDITGVAVDGNRATVEGTASVNGLSGFTFRVDVVDEPDAFAISVFTADGTVIHQTGTAAQPLPLAGGSIHIHKPPS